MSATTVERTNAEETVSRARSTRPLLFVCAVGAVLRVASFLLSENAGGDALARAQLTARWLQHPSLQLHFDVWLPLHFWMMGAVSLLVGDVGLGSRLLSLLLGVASVYAMWALVRELDGEGSALYSAVVCALYSLHVAYSVTSSCDVPYLFFVLAGLALFFRGRRERRPWLLAWGGLMLTVAAGIRYEAWVIIAAAGAVVLFRREWKGLLVLVPTAGAWPAFWMAYEWVTRGNPLYSPALNYSWVASDINFYGASLAYRLLLPPGVILITLTPLAVLGFVLSARRVWEARGALAEFAFVFAFFAAVQFYQIAAGGTMSYARYTLTLGAMVAALSGVGLYRSFRHKWLLVGVMAANLCVLSLFATFGNPFVNKVRSLAPVLHFTTYVEETGKYLKNHLGPHDAVVIDEYNYEPNLIASVAGLPLLESERALLIPDRTTPQRQEQALNDLLPYMRTRRPAYVVYAEQGVLRQTLRLPAGCSDAQVEEIHLTCVFRNEQYRIYKLGY